MNPLEEVSDKIATVHFNRPAAFNAFDRDMITSLADTLAELAKDTDVVGVIMTGDGKAFCTGGDLKWLTGSGKSYGVMFHSLAARYHLAILEVRRMPKPVIAAINGLAAGGGLFPRSRLRFQGHGFFGNTPADLYEQWSQH